MVAAMRKIMMIPLWGLTLSLLFGCTLAEVKVEVLSERTALENQVLGSYNSLDQQMLLAASVRGVDSQGRIRKPPQHSQDHKDAVAAMQLQAFHDDDIHVFKQLGWVGENNKGLLTQFVMDATDVPEDLKLLPILYKPEEFESIVRQINESRKIMMRRVIEINENLTESDIEKIQQIFGKLNAERALPGEKVQTETGDWSIKK